MEYTKGKLEVEECRGLFTVSTGTETICKFWELEEETHNKLEFENSKANAYRIYECWNGWDDLQKELERNTFLIEHGTAALIQKIESQRDTLLEASKEILPSISSAHLDYQEARYIDTTKLRIAIAKAESQ